MKTVQVTCACGATFSREVKRGRPQMWCPTCAAVPFYERASKPVVAVVATVIEGVEVAPKPVNKHDRLREVRGEIEAAMVVINAGHKARFAELVAAGASPMDAGSQAAKEAHTLTIDMYEPHRAKYRSDNAE